MKVIFQSSTISTEQNPTFTFSSTLKNGPKYISQKKLAEHGKLFLQMKDKILGKKYELSIVFVGKKRGRTLNKIYRKKDYATDILSFGLDEHSGEIFIQPEILEGKAKKFNRSTENYLDFLVIHGLFHLKGFDHGSKMEREEARIRASFKI